MSSVITGKVTRRENGYIYIDTNGDGIPDKKIFCAKNAFTLRVFRIWKECSALIEKDKNFSYLKIK